MYQGGERASARLEGSANGAPEDEGDGRSPSDRRLLSIPSSSSTCALPSASSASAKCPTNPTINGSSLPANVRRTALTAALSAVSAPTARSRTLVSVVTSRAVMLRMGSSP